MAYLLRLNRMPTLQRRVWGKFNPACRTIGISTSIKKAATCPPPNSPAGDCSRPEKPWVSYGFSYESEKEDTNLHKATFFFSVTICLVFGSFVWAYAPDVHMRDWAQREAFLVLRQRDKMGEKPINPHFIHPDFIKLPDEEDLCEVEIII